MLAAQLPGTTPASRGYVLATILQVRDETFRERRRPINAGTSTSKCPGHCQRSTVSSLLIEKGRPDQGSRCDIGLAHVPNTIPLSGPAVRGIPVIVEKASRHMKSAETARALSLLGILGSDPAPGTAHFGWQSGVNRSRRRVKHKRGGWLSLRPDVTLGRHTLAIASNGQRGAALPIDVVDATRRAITRVGAGTLGDPECGRSRNSADGFW